MVTVIVAAVMILFFFGIVFSSQGSYTLVAADSSQTFPWGSLESVQGAAFNGSSQQIGSMTVTPDLIALISFYTLYNGTSYTFQIFRQYGSTGGIYDVTVYSGR